MKMTLLEMVQNILSAMDSDEVNSINDTIESQQVAKVIEETYYEQFNNVEMPAFRQIIRIEGLGDLTKPNYLRLQDSVRKIDWLKYRDTTNDERFNNLDFCTPDEFFDRVLNNTVNNTNVTLVTDFSGVTYYVENDKAPTYYTSVDDKHLMFNSYDNSVDSTLQGAKTFAWGSVTPEWQNEDGFIPSLEGTLFPLLLSEAKSVCFVNVKQTASSKEEQRARRQRIRWQSDRYRDRKAQYRSYEGPNYARNRP